MMNINKLNFIVICFFTSIFFSSCDNMEDVHREYADKDEHIYLGKVDSLKAFSGLNRVKLTWYISSDPKIDSTVIYWNMKNDSIIKPFHRTTPSVQKDSIIIEDISEGTHLFECRNINENNESSLYSSVTGISWGDNFISNLSPRIPTLLKFNPNTSIYTVDLSSTFKEDGIVYSQVKYTNKEGENINLTINKESKTVEMNKFPINTKFMLRSVFFFPEDGIDSLYTDYISYDMPESAMPEKVFIPLTPDNVTGRDINYITFHDDGSATLLANGGDPDQRTMSINSDFGYGKYTAEFSELQMAPEDVNLTMSLNKTSSRQVELGWGFRTREDFVNGYKLMWRRDREWEKGDKRGDFDSTMPMEGIESISIDVKPPKSPGTVDVDLYLNNVLMKSMEATDVIADLKAAGEPLFLNFWILNSKPIGPSSLTVKVYYESHE